MSNQGPWPGRFIWHDLMTPDAAKSKAFYEAMFDWQFESRAIEGATYYELQCGPGPIGGLIEEKEMPAACWVPYVAVEDVDQVAARCEKLAGSIRVPPRDIPETGRFSSLVDPHGAALSIYKGQPDNHGFDPDLPVPGRFCWNEVLTTDDAAAVDFYTAMFGWASEPKDMGPMGTYHVQMLGDKQVAGIMKNPKNGAPTCWLSYVFVENLPAATDRAKALGGTTMVENAPIPDVGAFSMLADPCGAALALFASPDDRGQNC